MKCFRKSHTNFFNQRDKSFYFLVFEDILFGLVLVLLLLFLFFLFLFVCFGWNRLDNHQVKMKKKNLSPSKSSCHLVRWLQAHLHENHVEQMVTESPVYFSNLYKCLTTFSISKYFLMIEVYSRITSHLP